MIFQSLELVRLYYVLIHLKHRERQFWLALLKLSLAEEGTGEGAFNLYHP